MTSESPMDIDQVLVDEIDFSTSLAISTMLGILGAVIVPSGDIGFAGLLFWGLLWVSYGNPVVLHRYGTGTVPQGRFIAISLVLVSLVSVLFAVSLVFATGLVMIDVLVPAFRSIAVSLYCLGMTYAIFWWRVGILGDVFSRRALQQTVE